MRKKRRTGEKKGKTGGNNEIEVKLLNKKSRPGSGPGTFEGSYDMTGYPLRS